MSRHLKVELLPPLDLRWPASSGQLGLTTLMETVFKPWVNIHWAPRYLVFHRIPLLLCVRPSRDILLDLMWKFRKKKMPKFLIAIHIEAIAKFCSGWWSAKTAGRENISRPSCYSSTLFCNCPCLSSQECSISEWYSFWNVGPSKTHARKTCPWLSSFSGALGLSAPCPMPFIKCSNTL